MVFLVACATHHKPPEVAGSTQTTNSVPADLEAQILGIGKKYGVGVHMNGHQISIINVGTIEGIKSADQAENSIRQVLGKDSTNYWIIMSIY